MALETTGVSADSYASIAEADSYAADYFSSADLAAWNAASTAIKEAALRQATQYIDANFEPRFPGQIVSISQALAWPRVNAYDRAGRILTDIPTVIKNSTTELAGRRVVSGGSLVEAQERGVIREKVGPLEVEYTDTAASGAQSTRYLWATQLLSPVLKPAGRQIKRV